MDMAMSKLTTRTQAAKAGDYDEARADFEYLQTIRGLRVGWTHDDIWALLKAPTRANAATAYVNMIHFWLAENPDINGRGKPRISAIKKRWPIG